MRGREEAVTFTAQHRAGRQQGQVRQHVHTVFKSLTTMLMALLLPVFLFIVLVFVIRFPL